MCDLIINSAQYYNCLFLGLDYTPLMWQVVHSVTW